MSLSRRKILDEMGLSPYWVLRDAPGISCDEKKSGNKKHPVEAEPTLAECPPDCFPQAIENKDISAPIVPRIPVSVDSPVSTDTRATEIAAMGWEQLRQSMADCRACGLCAKRKQAVPGVGDENASWLFVGEGPGAEEDARGEPFVGQAGKLLDAMLAAINLKRGENVYIANAVKCRPPGNRTPENPELAACFPYLKRQIELISPKLIVLLGGVAVNSVLGDDRSSISVLRGKRLGYTNGKTVIPVIVTYHPAYHLRNLPEKSKAWEDLCRAQDLMATL